MKRFAALGADKFVMQGVHMVFDGEPLTPWQEGEPRVSKLIFIGALCFGLGATAMPSACGCTQGGNSIEACSVVASRNASQPNKHLGSCLAVVLLLEMCFAIRIVAIRILGSLADSLKGAPSPLLG